VVDVVGIWLVVDSRVIVEVFGVDEGDDGVCVWVFFFVDSFSLPDSVPLSSSKTAGACLLTFRFLSPRLRLRRAAVVRSSSRRRCSEDMLEVYNETLAIH